MKKASIALGLCLCLALTGCSTSLGSNTSTYFSQLQSKIALLGNSLADVEQAQAQAAGSESSETEADTGKTALASPGDWSVDAAGNYTFSGVEGADYYIIYMYDTLSADTSYAYMSVNIPEDGSGTYSGSLRDLFDYCYGIYNAEIVAYPAVGSKDVKKSAPSACDFSATGEVPAAQIAYLWDCFTNTLSVQLINVEEYGASSYPTGMEVTFTNTADASDVITFQLENVNAVDQTFYASTQQVTPNATYTGLATLTWDEQVVTNASASLTLENVTTASDKNAMTDGYGYLNTAVYQSLDYPMVVTDFDPRAGGSAGTWYYYINAFTTNKGVEIPCTFTDCLNFQGEKGSMGAEYHDGEDVAFTVTPTAASAGSAYSYTLYVAGPRDVVSLFDGFFFNDMPAGEGTLELYEDGTFEMAILAPESDGSDTGMPGRRALSASSISGLWVENGDGTLTLSYDHTSAALTE